MQTRREESGFDNSLAQECQNVICTHPGNNATCSQEGVVTPTSTTTTPPPVTLNCEQCIRKFLNEDQITTLISMAGQQTLGQVWIYYTQGHKPTFKTFSKVYRVLIR